jgi:glycosyltransferase involved in cell wall biosynthesis
VRAAPAVTPVAAADSYVGYAGRLSLEKGVDVLLEAARKCPVPVKIAGDGPEMERLRSSAPSNVQFLGRLDSTELARFYAESRIVVAPSRSYEAFPVAVAEAMMQGKAIIASHIGALPELIGDDERGMLVTVNDPDAVARAIQQLWNDETARARLGAAALAWASVHCSEDVFYRRLLAVYDRAIAITRSSQPASSARLEGTECVQ